MPDDAAMRRELHDLAFNVEGGRERIAAVAAHYGMPRGRKMREIPSVDVALLHLYTLGGETLPGGPATPEEIAADPYTDETPF